MVQSSYFVFLFYFFDFPDQAFLKHKLKMTDDCCIFKFLQCSEDRKYLMHFQSETHVLKFLWRDEDRA